MVCGVGKPHTYLPSSSETLHNLFIYLMSWYTIELMAFATRSFQSFISRNLIQQERKHCLQYLSNILYMYRMYTSLVNGA